jgi:hypothetical protein
MDRVDPDDLLDRELKALPQPRAPHTLLPRVMAAAALQVPAAAPTGWFTWTWPRRLASLTAFVVLVLAAYLIGTEPPSTVARATEAAADAATVVRVFRDMLFQPLAAYFLALGMLFALTCAAAWAIMEVALGGASQR